MPTLYIRQNGGTTHEPPRTTCERCGKVIRETKTLRLGFLPPIVQDVDRSSEIDEDACEDCGEEILAACAAYEVELEAARLAGGAP